MAQTVASKYEVKGKPDEVRAFDKGRLEVYNVGGHTIGRATFEPGWKWSECVKPIAQTRSCEASHLSFVISGKMRIKPDDGEEFELSAGQAFYLPPGHDAWVVGDEACVAVDFTGFADYAKPKEKPLREGRKH